MLHADPVVLAVFNHDQELGAYHRLERLPTVVGRGFLSSRTQHLLQRGVALSDDLLGSGPVGLAELGVECNVVLTVAVAGGAEVAASNDDSIVAGVTHEVDARLEHLGLLNAHLSKLLHEGEALRNEAPQPEGPSRDVGEKHDGAHYPQHRRHCRQNLARNADLDGLVQRFFRPVESEQPGAFVADVDVVDALEPRELACAVSHALQPLCRAFLLELRRD
mmetsp:Transcript_3138/g.4532  ORF Transcript_3138/g.4532 Transcript_3138/m.4532 type:complete len:220 (-) Transcript_3138:2200-2859(-)